jgi:transposase
MGRGIKLTEAESEALDLLRLRAPSADVFRNCLIILMSDSRDSIASIAQRLRCGTDTVNRIRRMYRMGGIGALYPTKPPGRKSRATPAYIKKMKQAIASNPMKLGYGFSTWSAIRLAAHLAQETDIHFGDDQMRRLLRQEGYSFQRPKHTLKGKRDEAAYEKARDKLIRLKKIPRRMMPPSF